MRLEIKIFLSLVGMVVIGVVFSLGLVISLRNKKIVKLETMITNYRGYIRDETIEKYMQGNNYNCNGLTRSARTCYYIKTSEIEDM